jgi:hypothetical protein
MGVRAEAPPLPALEVLDVPGDEIGVSLVLRECNYLQALEGDIDTSHFGFLHAGHVDPDDLAEGDALRHTITTRAPEYRVTDTAWGTQYAAYRPAGQALTYWRFGAFLFPFWTQQPSSEFNANVNARAWVPLDDGNTMFVFLWWKRGVSTMSQPQPAFRDGTPIGGMGRGNKFLPNTTDWLGRFRLAANPSNDWQIDRTGTAGRHDLQRCRGRSPAGPGDHREHGANHRSPVRASRAIRPDDSPYAPPPADRGASSAR